MFNISHPKGIIFGPRLRIALSHLREHNLKYSFLDTLNPVCNCDFDIEALITVLHQCFFTADSSFSTELIANMLNSSIDYILSTKRFESPFFTKNLTL